jgi:histidyl-tRNA synthetase
MFTFLDKGEREMALRPEGTPGAVRAYIEHNLYKLAQPVKLFYIGPMFRQERQQKGRYRQHTQIGVEALGTSDPLVDVEVISLLYAIHQAVGVKEEVVYVNNLGDLETRQVYVPELRAYLQRHRSELDPDSLSRMDTNPLRTFDSKHEGTQAVLAEAPRITSYLSSEASAHLEAVRKGLEALGIPYEIDDRLVRGLDYYTMTVFEAKSGALGAQDTVGAGGRYNGLISDLGGPDLGGIGFGSGVERMLLAAASRETTSPLDVFFVTLTPEARIPAMQLAGALREEGISSDLDYGGRGMRAQFKQADRMGAYYAAILGEEELARGVCTVRDMASGEERVVPVVDGAKDLIRAVAG